HAGLAAHLVLNKCDLGDVDEAGASLEGYARAGYSTHRVSARTGAGVERLRHACLGRRSLFAGHSGVGKRTLLNAIAPGRAPLAAEVNGSNGQGRPNTS